MSLEGTRVATMGLVLLLSLAPAASPQEAPQAVRNDVPQAGIEFLVLRHQKLIKDSHQRFYELSRAGVWPLFEEIGARVVGQWQVVHPHGDDPALGDDPAPGDDPGDGGQSEDYDEGYRLARYRSHNHWLATRRAEQMAGNGPDLQASRAALAARRELLLGSDGAIFLQGSMAPGGPYFLAGLDEIYEVEEDPRRLADDAPRPVRHERSKPGEEILTLRYFKIAKGTFEEFNRLSRDGVWPYFEKMGARIVGQWLVVHPAASDSPDYDEAYMLVRYASHEHWQATRPNIMDRLGGNGPDYELCQEALRRRRSLTLETSVRFLQGFMYSSPPIYLPALEESYRLLEPEQR